jgi:hypothetical protein
VLIDYLVEFLVEYQHCRLSVSIFLTLQNTMVTVCVAGVIKECGHKM